MSAFDGQEKDSGESGRSPEGKFLPGNTFWRGTNMGRRKIYENPDDLFAACLTYFDWVDANPLYEMKVFGTGLKMKVEHPRAMTLHGLTAHVGMSRRSWDNYRANPEFKPICEAAEDIMFDQKFAGAAAGFFNANIIARDLGLADKREVDTELTIEVIDSYGEEPDGEDNDS